MQDPLELESTVSIGTYETSWDDMTATQFSGSHFGQSVAVSTSNSDVEDTHTVAVGAPLFESNNLSDDNDNNGAAIFFSNL